MSYISADVVRKGRSEHVVVWERRDDGKRVAVAYNPPYYYFRKNPHGTYKSIFNEPLEKIQCSNGYEYNKLRREIRGDENIYELDIDIRHRVLADNYYNAEAPYLHVTFLDIEVDYNKDIGFANADSYQSSYAPINSIALDHYWSKERILICVPPENQEWDVDDLNKKINEVEEVPGGVEIFLCENEHELLQVFLALIEDSDVLCGWNSDFFDLPYIGWRLIKMDEELNGVPSYPTASQYSEKPYWSSREYARQFGSKLKFFSKLDFPNASTPVPDHTVKVRQKNTGQMLDMKTINLNGRIKGDYLALFKKYEMAERPSYKLESISDEILPNLPKLEYEGSLADLYRKDFPYFARYNIRDTEILSGFEDKLGYVALANTMYHISCGLFDNVTGTIKLAELAIQNYCHHELDQKVPCAKQVSLPVNAEGKTEGIAGAFVLDPKVGMHDWIGSIDINSLYPSSIRSINISPEMIIGQFREEETSSEQIALGSFTKLVLEYDNKEREPEVHTADEWRDILWDKKWAVSGYGTVFSQRKKGIIPIILEEWYTTRKKYQKMMREAEDDDKKAYYNRLQYVYKIKLNSLYGALTNPHFKFFDLRMGESTTGTGRVILLHQCAKANEMLLEEYDSKGEAVIYGDSVAGDTLINTPNGTIQISELFTTVDYTKGTKEYSNVNGLGLTFNPSTGENEFRQIKYVVRHKVNKQMYRVWIGNTRYVDVTEDHSLIGYANTKSKTPGLVNVKPTEIGNNFINSLLLSSHLPTAHTKSLDLSNEMYQLIGYIIGDGHVEKRKEGGVGLSVGNKDKQEVINKLITPLIKQGWFTSFIEMKNSHDIRLLGVKGWSFLRKSLYYTEEKKDFPLWIHSETPNHIAQVLKGYFSADGFANKNKIIGLCSTNQHFIRTANTLLKRCGIGSNYWTETTENSYKEKYSGTYTTRLTVYDAVKFRQQIGFIQERKNKNVKQHYSKATHHCLTQTGYVLINPTKVEPISYDDYVYDIEIEDTHTFYANDILVHNTDSTYFKTFAEDEEEAILVADTVAERVNDSFQKFMQDTFLCQPEFDDIIKAGREIVASKGIFVKKKRYILRVVDSEGAKVDKLKVMGLDTKKTIIPKEVGNKLNSYIGRLLRGEDWETIAKDIVDFKNYIRTTDDIMAIGLPKGIQGVEEYTRKYDANKTERLPGHVAAAIHYNIAIKEYDDKVSEPIKSGMKIKVFYLTEKHGKFKSMALPTDLNSVPDWFLEYYTIDRDAHIQRLVDKPLQNILDAINKKTPSAQTVVVDSLLSF